ncbi:MAG: AAA family ATPase [Ramlibacter sp.]
MTGFKFIRKKNTQVTPVSLRSCWILTEDDWDDYGFKTQFRLSYIDESGSSTTVGKVKILRRRYVEQVPEVAKTTILPDGFQELDADFISLGQDENYYKRLHELLHGKVGAFLEALSDIAWNPTLANEYEPTSGFRNSLLRMNAAQRSRRLGRAWATGQPVQENFSFSYNCLFGGADAPIDVDISFDEDDPLPHRVVGIIGRNAVGKTRFLAQLSEDLVQLYRTSAEALQTRDKRFPGGRPLFTRVITISYSAFDRFKRPAERSGSSYVYCGIRNESGNLSRKSLIDAYRKNQDRIRLHGREHHWLEHMQNILGDQSEALTSALQSEISSDDGEGPLSLLSSGQSILCHFITALLAWIEPNSLILFDEPETHLHPNAVASLFSVLNRVLNKYESFAVLATHSPVVIQEIPAKRVLMFQREGNVTVSFPLNMESFGESVAELTKHVFETVEIENPYKKTLRQLSGDYDEDEVLDMFEQGLSLNAQAYLLAQYSKKRS